MSTLERIRNDAGDEERPSVRKGVLFCPDCGRRAPSEEWVRNDDGGAETLECPDCGAVLTIRPRVVA